MPNALYNQYGGGNNNMLQRLIDFRKNFNGDPQQTIQQMLNSGRISQAQMNAYVQQANEIYNQFKNFL